MNWHVQTILHAVLLALVWREPGRKYWKAWLLCRFVFDAGQLVAERTGHLDISTSAWYVGTVLQAPLVYLALHEAATLFHRRILFAWVAFSTAAAWVRFFPYTGAAVILVDATVYLIWIVEKLWRQVRTFPTRRTICS